LKFGSRSWGSFAIHSLLELRFCVDSLVEMAEPERLVQSSSFKKFLKTVGIDSNSTGERSASLPSKGAKSASTFYSYSSEDLAECKVPFKCGWLLRQSRGVLRSWQVGHDQNGVFDFK